MTVILAAIAVVGAFVLAFYTRNRSRRTEARYTARGGFVEVQGVPLHVVSRGEGRPVVMLHGSLGSAHDFLLSIFDRVAGEYRAIAIDRPGHGHSHRPRALRMTPSEHARYVRGALAKLSVEKAVLLGHSCGGPVAMAMAIEHPEAVAGLVLLSTVAYPAREHDHPIYSFVGLPVFGDLALATLLAPLGGLLAPRVARSGFSPHACPAEFAEISRALALRPTHFRAEAGDMLALNQALESLAPRYSEIQVPTVIVTGDRDACVDPWGHSYPLRRAIPHAQLVVMKGAGHAIAFSHPEAVLAACHSVCDMARDRREVPRTA